MRTCSRPCSLTACTFSLWNMSISKLFIRWYSWLCSNNSPENNRQGLIPKHTFWVLNSFNPLYCSTPNSTMSSIWLSYIRPATRTLLLCITLEKISLYILVRLGDFCSLFHKQTAPCFLHQNTFFRIWKMSQELQRLKQEHERITVIVLRNSLLYLNFCSFAYEGGIYLEGMKCTV